MHRYPEELPLFNLGWKVNPLSAMLESQPERGPVKRRRLNTGISDILSGTCRMSENQLNVFIDFWDNYIDGGMNVFLYPDFVRTQDYRRTRFRGSYSYTRNSKSEYTVEVSLEMLP